MASFDSPTDDKTKVYFKCKAGYRLCADETTCILKDSICPDEDLIQQKSVLIMVVIGMAVVIFLLILYCFQQRSQEHSQRRETRTETDSYIGDNASFYLPPPTYEEVIGSNLYPCSSVAHQTMVPASPTTPPPNYDAALTILENSKNSSVIPPAFTNMNGPVIRRSVSTDLSVSGRPPARQSITDYRRLFSTQDVN